MPLMMMINSKKSNSASVGTSPKKSNTELLLDSKSKESFFRADKIDFKTFDTVGLDQFLSKIWSKKSEIQEEWEIELNELDIRNVIAHGTYGTVYKALYDGQHVAVKVLDWEEDGLVPVLKAAALRSSFQQEAAIWHKLDHPNVTKFIGASMGTWDLKIPSDDTSKTRRNSAPSRACCVVVEYLQGGTLKKYLNKNTKKKLSFKIVVELALDLSRGLSYLHSKNIVHRDIKTENMLLDAHGTLKIADFGVARVEALNPRDMTGVTGTLSYMAPEVFDGKPYNRKCDVYSFGICLWEIYCCDMMPYADLSFAEIPSAVVNQNSRPKIPKCCPKAFASILKKCWDVKPENRPEMEDVVKLLEALDTSKGGGMVPEDQVAYGCFGFYGIRGH